MVKYILIISKFIKLEFSETKRRCGFFLDVFGLTLPDYLDCSLFPEKPERGQCVGYQEVKLAKIRAQQPGNYISEIVYCFVVYVH